MGIEELIHQVNLAMRKQSGMEVRLLKHEYEEHDSQVKCQMLIGLRYGHETWFEAKPSSLSALQFTPLPPELPQISFNDHITHHAYQGVFTISTRVMDDPIVPAMLASNFESWWKFEEDMELAEKAYKELPQELQEAIGWFVDEPTKSLDFNQERDRMDWLLYQELRDLELVRTERWMSGDGHVYPLDKGMQIIKYLIRQRKKDEDKNKS